MSRPEAEQAQACETAWRARVAGATWAQAAKVAGYSDASNCLKAVKRHRGELPEPAREDLRALWRERLELLWQQSVRDVADRRAGAVTAAVRVVGTALALDGLNAPVEVTVRTEDTLDALLASLTTPAIEGEVISAG